VIDTEKSGTRCRAKSILHSHAATIPPGDQGTIIHEMENLGRRLILVHWDSGPSMYAFAEEIEIIAASKPPQS
jgi:hypothetical protein